MRKVWHFGLVVFWKSFSQGLLELSFTLCLLLLIAFLFFVYRIIKRKIFYQFSQVRFIKTWIFQETLVKEHKSSSFNDHASVIKMWQHFIFFDSISKSKRSTRTTVFVQISIIFTISTNLKKYEDSLIKII